MLEGVRRPLGARPAAHTVEMSRMCQGSVADAKSAQLKFAQSTGVHRRSGHCMDL